MPREKAFERDTLDHASFMVPLGIHMTDTGSVTFDVVDDELLEDISTMIAVFAQLNPVVEDGRNISTSNVKTLASQRAALTEITKMILRQMGAPDGGDAQDHDTMLASAFDRFPQFADFRELAAGCGDLEVDPLHEDSALAEQVKPNYGAKNP